jgi:small subunit ribosomal protein S1
VELEPGVEGLVHVSEMSWTKKNVHPGKIVSTSQEVEVMVLDVDASKRRIALGLKQTMANPWEQLRRTAPGRHRPSRARSRTSPNSACSSACPATSTAWSTCPTSTGNAPAKRPWPDFKKGEMVKAKVLDVDVEKERISLGIKQLADDPYEGAIAKLKKGDVVTCTVTAGHRTVSRSPSTACPGFIRKAELSRDRSEQRPDRFAVGEKVDAKITAIDKATRKLTLSIKAKEVDEEKQAMADYGSSDSGASLGDILGAAANRLP